jgi:N-dimethylarginine dimethylaminohydrolase
MVFLVCSPSKEAIELGSKDPSKYLYHDSVISEEVFEQHSKFIEILKQTEKVIDISKWVPADCPTESLPNLIFIRDGFISTSKGVILGRMRYCIRDPETAILEAIFNKLQVPILTRIDNQGILEGGDFVQTSTTSFFAVGTRSNRKAVEQLMRERVLDTKTVAIIYTDAPDPSMYRIHLDCVFGVIHDELCLVWDKLLDPTYSLPRWVDEYKWMDGYYYLHQVKIPLVEYLLQTGMYLIPISDAAQQKYGCNIVRTKNCVFTQEEESTEKLKPFISVTQVKVDAIHQMYGGLHCATNEIIE